MAYCNGCGGWIGRDCFNPIECERITHEMTVRDNAPTFHGPQFGIPITELEDILTSQLPAPAKVNQLMILIENYKAK